MVIFEFPQTFSRTIPSDIPAGNSPPDIYHGHFPFHFASLPASATSDGCLLLYSLLSPYLDVPWLSTTSNPVGFPTRLFYWNCNYACFSDILDRDDTAVPLYWISPRRSTQSVDHGILLERLRVTFSVDNLALAWFQSHLAGRRQHVCCGGKCSICTDLICDVPRR